MINPGIPSSSIFTFNKEDHTLGNLLRSRLLQSPHVKFAGYKVPHPLVRYRKSHAKPFEFLTSCANPLVLVSQFQLRVQTDGTLSPRAALLQCCKDLVNDLSILSREFTKEFELRKMVGDGAKADEKKDDKRLGR